jgi:hypothetical protein
MDREVVYCQECGHLTEGQDPDNPCCDACIEYLTGWDAIAYYEPPGPPRKEHWHDER